MKNRTNIFVSVVLLIVYGTVTFVAVPLHFHEDPLFISGNGEQTIAQHDDATHCHHRSVGLHIDCTICSLISHSSISKGIAIGPQIDPETADYVSALKDLFSNEISTSHPRRGPPAELA